MLSIPHLILLFVIALIVFGPEKLPQLARTLGKAMAEFRKVTGDLRRVVDDEMRDMERQTRENEIRKRDAAAQQALPGVPASSGDSVSSAEAPAIGAAGDTSVGAPFENTPTPDAPPESAPEISESTPSMAPPGTVPGERPGARAAEQPADPETHERPGMNSAESATHASS